MSKLRVAVLYGGPSKEHEVSINSGKEMINALNDGHYDIYPILISKDSEWNFGEEKLSQNKAIEKLKNEFDFVLLGLHGTFGEDGTVQALLEENHIKFSGSGSHASRVAIDKHESSELFFDAGFKVPKEKVIRKGFDRDINKILEDFELPVFVKPLTQGSSVGISKVTQAENILTALDEALSDDTSALVQEYIEGREISCGVYEEDLAKLTALPPTELIPVDSEFYDYDAKYTKGKTDEITPPKISEDIIQRIQKISVSAHKVIGCSGYSRTDFLVRGDEIFVLEINTLPGMTQTSIMPQEAQAVGMSLGRLLDLIIQAGLRKGV